MADAYLDRAPLVALTGQGDLSRMHKESHQYIDVVSLMRPITKWNARVSDAAIVPEAVRKAFAVAQAEKPGSTHLELPEDVMGTDLAAVGGDGWAPLPVHPPVRPEPAAREMLRAADIIRDGAKVVALAGNGAVRGAAAGALREFCRATGIPVAETFMGKGLVAADSAEALGATGLQAGDYEMAGFADADVVVTIGYDLVEQSPQQWNPRRDKTIVCIDTLPAEIDAYYTPAVELVGDIYHVLLSLAEECRGAVRPGGSSRLRDATAGLLERSPCRRRASPCSPPRVLADIRARAGTRRHPRERRRAAQALDRTDVPRLRAEHHPDRQRPGRHGLRRSGRHRRQARPPVGRGGGRQRRRRIRDERPGAGDGQAAAGPRS